MNTMKLIKDLGQQFTTKNSKQKRRFGLYECPICKIHVRARTNSIKSFNTTKCRSCSTTKHGYWGEPLYRVWHQMKQRCLNKNNAGYLNYGGRGIYFIDEWKYFINFKDWALKNGYSKDLTIDRINNDKEYSPSNCRFVTREIQSRNTRKIRSTNTSGFRGVSYNKKKNKWEASISVNYKQTKLGYFSEKENAAIAYDNYVIKNKLEHTLNFKHTRI